MQRGIVVEIQAKHWVVMTTDGAFINVPFNGSNVQLGEEITIQTKPSLPSINWKIFASGAVAALFAFFFLFSGFFGGNPALAQSYIYVEIGPSVKMGLNKNDEVVVIRPINLEAKNLLGQLVWEEEPVEKVVVDYLKKAKIHGHIKKKESLVLSTVDHNDKSSKTLQKIRSVISSDKQLGKKQLDLHVYAFSLPEIVQVEAERSGMTPGKYGVWLLSKKSGKDIAMKEMADKQISELTEDSKVSNFLDDPPSEKEWKELVKNKGEKESPKDTDDKVDVDPEKPKPDTQQSDKQPKDQPEENDSKQTTDEKPTESKDDPKNDEDKPSEDSKDEPSEEEVESDPLPENNSDSQTKTP